MMPSAIYIAYLKENISDDRFENHNIIKLGFWPGGDRDGNPFVTAKITKQVADELRLNLMKCYYNELKRLQQKLTFKELHEHLKSLRANLYTAMFDTAKPIGYDDIIKPLQTIRSILVEKYFGLYLRDLDHLIDKVKIFKTHFAILDIRQDHSVHTKAVSAILKRNGFVKEHLGELTKARLRDILLKEDIKVAAKDYKDPLVKDTIRKHLPIEGDSA